MRNRTLDQRIAEESFLARPGELPDQLDLLACVKKTQTIRIS